MKFYEMPDVEVIPMEVEDIMHISFIQSGDPDELPIVPVG